ncbi:MAG: hypothetical protein K2N72_05055 [Oscillospiraceae bacterium]|nr:hypothetical protein [Oscillospiraceae bacterium]
MNIVDKIIQNLCGDSGSDSAAERKKSGGTSPDNSGRIWKKFYPTSQEKERARAAYLKITADGYAAGDNFNADNGFNDSLLLLDSFDALQKKRFMKICRELVESCYNEKDFYDKNSRGCLYDYVSESFGKPDLSVMRGISPEDFPYFLAAAAACKSGYVREEALRLGAEYPMLLSLIIGGFNDRVKQVRTAAEKSFDIAFDSLARIIDEDPESCDIYPIYKMHPLDKPVRPRYKALAILFSTRARAADVSRGGRFDSEKLAAAENRLDSIILKNLDEQTVKFLGSCCISCYIKLIIGWFDLCDRLHVYRELFKKGLISWECAKLIIDNDGYVTYMGAYSLASVYTNPPEEGLRELAACSDPRARCNAAGRLFENHGLWEGSEALLTDPAASVRETAVYYFEKLSDMDLHGFYMARLPEIHAIGGLARCSHTAEQKAASVCAIRPLIDSEHTRTAVAAICSLAVIDDSDSAAEEFYELIKDGRPRVSKTALNAFLRTGKPVDCKRIYEDILQAIERQKKWVLTNPQLLDITVRRLTSALYRQSCATVKRFPWVLRLCVSENENVSREASIHVNCVVRKLYGIGDRDKEEIRQALEEVKQKGFRPPNADFYRQMDFLIK